MRNILEQCNGNHVQHYVWHSASIFTVCKNGKGNACKLCSLIHYAREKGVSLRKELVDTMLQTTNIQFHECMPATVISTVWFSTQVRPWICKAWSFLYSSSCFCQYMLLTMCVGGLVECIYVTVTVTVTVTDLFSPSCHTWHRTCQIRCTFQSLHKNFSYKIHNKK
jgi:hypothetical protein